MDDWTMADTLSLGDRIAEEHANAELEKRYALCLENNCKTIIEYNRTAEKPLKRYFMVFPFVHTLTKEERKTLCNIANKGRAQARSEPTQMCRHSHAQRMCGIMVFSLKKMSFENNLTGEISVF